MFTLANSPLAVVLAQFSLHRSIDRPAIERLRNPLRQVGLERLTKKNARTVSVTPQSITPVVKDVESWVLLDAAGTKGLAVSENTLSCFVSDYQGFVAFSGYLCEVVNRLSAVGHEFFASTIALRYVNVFELDDDVTKVLTGSLGGLPTSNLGTEHYHHTYEFWCDIADGRLTLRFATAHGDRKPAQLGHAEAVFPPNRLRSYDDIVGHLDIFAANPKPVPPKDWQSTRDVLGRMNLKIEQAFLNAVREEALVQMFGAKEKTGC
jgi:uncharacterized protein (TIGR04255 family)